ncbi:MAG TPA: glycosyltransferase family 39 protein [Jatrophihabitans sp.]|jgi:4-amino-4-deoxy-L-arabinose transferase-like glycosyltransferase
MSGRYGYHRDELYFRVIGAHPAFGYDDQPPLVPLLDHLLDTVGGKSLVVLRLPAACAGVAIILITAALCRRLGGDTRAQTLAAITAAVSAYLVSVGHLSTTTIYDCLMWALVSLLVVKALSGNDRAWIGAGAVIGLAGEVKTLALVFAAVLVLWVLAARGRTLLRCPQFWIGALLAAALAAPDLLWQQAHGWPQFALSRSIASGSSGSSQSPWIFLPFQLLLVSPVLAPVWLLGLWRLARDRHLRPYRPFALTYLTLAVVFMFTHGKPYYVAGLFPILIAAGAPAVIGWMRSGRARLRTGSVGAAVALSGVVSAVLMLPVLPVAVLPDTPVTAINYDAGEQVGWPTFAHVVAQVRAGLPATERSHAIVLAANYGEAGALARYQPEVPTYGAQNSLWDLGQPPADTTAAVVVGFRQEQLHQWFVSVRGVRDARNPYGVDNDEQGRVIYLCARPRLPWSRIWLSARHLG